MNPQQGHHNRSAVKSAHGHPKPPPSSSISPRDQVTPTESTEGGLPRQVVCPGSRRWTKTQPQRPKEAWHAAWPCRTPVPGTEHLNRGSGRPRVLASERHERGSGPVTATRRSDGTARTDPPLARKRPVPQVCRLLPSVGSSAEPLPPQNSFPPHQPHHTNQKKREEKQQHREKGIHDRWSVLYYPDPPPVCIVTRARTSVLVLASGDSSAMRSTDGRQRRAERAAVRPRAGRTAAVATPRRAGAWPGRVAAVAKAAAMVTVW